MLGEGWREVGGAASRVAHDVLGEVEELREVWGSWGAAGGVGEVVAPHDGRLPPGLVSGITRCRQVSWGTGRWIVRGTV